MDYMGKITYNDQLILRRHYKFEPIVIKEIKSNVKKGINKMKLLALILPIKKKPISQNILALFYENPA